jgi:hypothetical protein
MCGRCGCEAGVGVRVVGASWGAAAKWEGPSVAAGGCGRVGVGCEMWRGCDVHGEELCPLWLAGNGLLT